MPQSVPSYESMAPLMQAKSEGDLTRVCQLALTLTKTAESSDRIAVDECAELLTVDTARAKATLNSVRLLAQQCNSANSGADISTDSFPDKFPRGAATLLSSIISRLTRETVLSRNQNYVPQLESLDWRIDVKAASNGCSRMSVPTCLLQMQMRDDARADCATSSVTVEVTKESMTTLLDGLGKIRDQLSGIAN